LTTEEKNIDTDMKVGGILRQKTKQKIRTDHSVTVDEMASRQQNVCAMVR
jgi:hypothetical protein